MAPLDKENVLTVLKQRGPLVPNELKKHVGGDTMLLGAVLSELSSRGLAKITDVKKGGSPFYYVPGQEQKLEGLMEFLNPKDQEVVQRLKANKVLADKSQELIVRVSLRKTKDYSKQLNVNTSQGPMLFWRYYLIGEQEALDILKARYNNTTNQAQPQPIQTPATQQQESTTQPKQPPTQSQQPQEQQQEQQEAPPQENKEQPRTEYKHQSQINAIRQAALEKQQTDDKKTAEEEKDKQQSETKIVSEVASEKQQSLSAPPRLERTPFYIAVRDYFEKHNIKVLDELQVAKEREYEFRLRIPSAVGDLELYCVARNKKKLTQNDVAAAVLKAKKRDLQLFYLTNGEFTKKGLEIVEKEYKGVIIKNF